MKPLTVWYLGALCLLLMGLNGCVTMRSHVTLKGDGSADVEYVVALDQSMQGMMGAASPGGQDPMKELKDGFAKDGFKISEYKENNQSGMRAVKHVKDIKALEAALNTSALKNSNDSSGVANEKQKAAFGELGKGIQVQKSF